MKYVLFLGVIRRSRAKLKLGIFMIVYSRESRVWSCVVFIYWILISTVYGLWWWQLLPQFVSVFVRVCVCENVDGVWADGGSVRTDEHTFGNQMSSVNACVFGTNIYILHILRDDEKNVNQPIIHVFSRSAADVYSTLHADYCVWRWESRFSRMTGANACETRIRLALKSDFISNYILLDHYARHLCRYEISHPRINFAAEWRGISAQPDITTSPPTWRWCCAVDERGENVYSMRIQLRHKRVRTNTI